MLCCDERKRRGQKERNGKEIQTCSDKLEEYIAEGREYIQNGEERGMIKGKGCCRSNIKLNAFIYIIYGSFPFNTGWGEKCINSFPDEQGKGGIREREAKVRKKNGRCCIKDKQRVCVLKC